MGGYVYVCLRGIDFASVSTIFLLEVGTFFDGVLYLVFHFITDTLNQTWDSIVNFPPAIKVGNRM